MTKSLEGQRALVVGGGSGIGFASAAMLARDGARVTLAGRTESKLIEACGRLEEQGLSARWTVCDVLDGCSTENAVAEAAEGSGLDIAVVVPGGGAISPVLLFDDEDFIRQIGLNVRPAFFTIKHAGRAMVRSGGGSIIAISSTAAVMPSRFLASYCAGKAAVDHLVRVAADELGEYGVRVNTVRPGLTRTPTTEGMFQSADMVEAFLALQPIPRSGEADDIAEAVRYFAGPESGWVTGQALTVDGGHTLRAFIDYRELLDIPDTLTVLGGEAASSL
jgi:NAD(P)-dependent dehydrogenase (short-subunit alcohol dehydrogenase family)